MTRQIATFATPYDADRVAPGARPSAVKVIAILVGGDGATPRTAPAAAASSAGAMPGALIEYVVVDHDHRTAIVPAAELIFTDASVQPPRYG